MRKLVLGVVVEVFLALAVAGLILALAIPLLNRSGALTVGDFPSAAISVGVIAGILAVALFRPGSAIHRYIKRSAKDS